MSIRLLNPCEAEEISAELRDQCLAIQNRCVECGSSSKLEIHHRIFRSQYTPETMKQFMAERSKLFGKEIYWDLNSGQNLVVLCCNCHTRLHNGGNILSEKYRESFTDIANGRNIYYDPNGHRKYQ